MSNQIQTLNSKRAIIETQYFPSIAFFAIAMQYNECAIEAHETYQKRSFRNKTEILSANGRQSLSVPLQKGKNSHSPIVEVKISYSEAWTRNHIQSIRSAYENSPFFEYYFEDITGIINQEFDFLFDLNISLIKFFESKIELTHSVSSTTEYKRTFSAGEDDWRNAFLPKNAYLSSPEIVLPPYLQVFSDRFSFEQNLSILDALFCMGPETSLYLKNCRIQGLNSD